MIAAVAISLLLVGGLVWALVAQDGDEAAPAVTSSAALVAEGQSLVTAVAEREQAPSFSVQTASFGDGSTFNVEDSRGEVVILLFTAAWCTSCGPETQALANVYDRYASLGIQALIVDVDTTESEEDLRSYRKDWGEGAHLWALDTEVAQTFRVQSLGTTIIIDREGNVAYRDGRMTDYDTYAAVVEALR